LALQSQAGGGSLDEALPLIHIEAREIIEMTGRRVTVGLSLLCALAFCAFAAPSAMAAPSGTAYYTCAPKAHGPFEDAHCTKEVADGNFEHQLIPAGTTEITISNNKTGAVSTNALLVGENAGGKFELEATGFMGEKSWVENTTPSGEAMVGVGGGEGTYTGVTVKNLPKCGVESEGKKDTVKQLPASSETVGDEITFKPTGTAFAEFTFYEKEKSCALKGQTIKVEGSASATTKGATLVFTKASTEATKATCEGKEAGMGLCSTKKPAYFTAEFTVKMGKEGAEDGNPITMTTTS
jgi:hypothetical protein